MAEQRQMRYTPFMEEALSKFVRNDHKGCLEDLRFLMGQYPDDVNALFYAGLCCYNLGMNERAKEFLQRAATHPVSLFDEEATWYHALSLERLGDGDQARIEFARIAKAGGYYAERASNHASQH
jgi:tetratricopeptide (TPR) repeat protein